MKISPLHAPIYSIQSPYTAPHHRRQSYGFHSAAPEAIRSQGLAVAISPVFSGGIPILYPAPHSITQELRRLLIQGMRHKCLGRGGALICL